MVDLDGFMYDGVIALRIMGVSARFQPPNQVVFTLMGQGTMSHSMERDSGRLCLWYMYVCIVSGKVLMSYRPRVEHVSGNYMYISYRSIATGHGSTQCIYSATLVHLGEQICGFNVPPSRAWFHRRNH